MNSIRERQSIIIITGGDSTASANAFVAGTRSSNQLAPTFVNNDTDKDPDESRTNPSKSGKTER